MEAQNGPQPGDIFDHIAPGASDMFANNEKTAIAQGGNILMVVMEIDIVTGAKILVNTQDSGDAGNITVGGGTDSLGSTQQNISDDGLGQWG
jgi:hypothetical protein